jgi:hypothetical protein
VDAYSSPFERETARIAYRQGTAKSTW